MSQAVLHDETPVDPDDELLVAYLDGELDAKSENELMNRLMDDPQLNERLQQLQEGWDWLDTLPNATPSEKLVESTLELVVADVVKTKPETDSHWGRHRCLIGVISACILAVVVSLVVVAVIKHRQYQQQLRDLEIAEYLDAYLRGDDLDLMRQLNADPAWSQMIAAAREIGEFSTVDDPSVAEIPIGERSGALTRLPLEDQPRLAARWNAFLRLDERSEQQVRRTAAAVAAQPDAESLLRTMEIYSIWVEKLPTELRDELESNDRKVQRDAIEKAIALTQASTLQRSREQLSDEAVERIYFALSEILQQRIDAGDEPTIRQLESTSEFVSRWPGNVDPEPFVIMAIVNGGESSPWSSRGRRPSFGGRIRRDHPAPLRDDELEMIRLILPDDAHDMLEVITSAVSVEDTMAARNLTLRSWAEAATRRKMPRRPESTLLERYEALSPADRERIDLLPPKELLERMTPNWPLR